MRNLLTRLLIVGLHQPIHLAPAFSLVASSSSSSGVEGFKHPLVLLSHCSLLFLFQYVQVYIFVFFIPSKQSQQFKLLFVVFAFPLQFLKVSLITEEEIRFSYDRSASTSDFITASLSRASWKFKREHFSASLCILVRGIGLALAREAWAQVIVDVRWVFLGRVRASSPLKREDIFRLWVGFAFKFFLLFDSAQN